ncbi:gas vesicle protein GvpJ [Streptomyces sp. GESEQ-35]|uniref:gas vesicle protein GvpJ n=1 Tax=Streptomyces sp. GESEQ-35 TaxID=2812657 RepID=UPI001B323F58|nr:gas vesicle protein GvpJ [Streptomyces sp. GESEQ-35]
MTVVPVQQTVVRGGSSGLYDILELILDKGIVIDAFIRVSLIGIEILRIDVRVVVASVDTYLRFAEACNRLDLEARPRSPELATGLPVGPPVASGLPEVVGEITESRPRAGMPTAALRKEEQE